MTIRRIGNPSRVPPFAGEVRVLLDLLVGRQPGEDAEQWLYGMVGVGWIESARGGVAITEAGRDALSRELLRAFAGSLVVVNARGFPTDHQARVLLRIHAGKWTTVKGSGSRWASFDAACDAGWITSYGAIALTPAGRGALAAYLLRGWRP